MADHMVYQVRVQFSLDPEDPRSCEGEEIAWRPPGQDGWNLKYDYAHAGNPLTWCVDVARARVLYIAQELPRALPFE